MTTILDKSIATVQCQVLSYLALAVYNSGHISKQLYWYAGARLVENSALWISKITLIKYIFP